mgnify:FL=1
MRSVLWVVGFVVDAVEGAVCELRDTSPDVAVEEEGDRTVRDCFVSGGVFSK